MGFHGVGTVWRAHDQRRDQDVAIQEVVLPPAASAAERQALCARSVREAWIVARLRHPAVVPICDVVVDGERPWIVMEFLPARSLHEIVRDDGPLPFSVVADIGLHVLGALEAAHRAGILHRDVKPSNVLVGEGGWATLTGFCVARTSGDSAMTSAGLALCSPPFIPPERARGGEATAASDLWSLGASLFTAVEGRPPFDEGDPLPTLAAILANPPVPLHRAGPLAPVLAGLLDKDPRRRWDLERTRAGLRAVLTGADPPAREPPSAQPGQTHRPAQHSQHRAPRAPPRARSPSGATKPPWRRPSLRRAGQHRVAVAAGAVACVLIAALLAGAFVGFRWRGEQLAPLPEPGPSAPPSPSSTLRPSVSLPTTYVRYQHRFGFSVDVPSGWRKLERSDGDTIFREPGGDRMVGLQRVRRAGDSIGDYWRAGDATEKKREGYQLVGIRSAKLGTHPGADWEFRRRLGTGTVTAQHTIGRGAIVDGTAYIVYLATPEPDFSASTPILDRMAASFTLSR